MNPMRCPNLNHRRSDARVRICPMCGEIVNPNVRATRCNEEEHARQRKSGDHYCTGCGEHLRT
jgi:hypothetical protein